MGKKITLDQGAEDLGVSKRTIRRLISSGELRAYRIGRLRNLIRIDSDDVAELLNPVIPNGKL